MYNAKEVAGVRVTGITNNKEKQHMDEQLRERLKGLWDGSSEYVMDGPRHYRVMTPNGPEEPVFIAMQEGIGTYGSTSTGFLSSPEPGQKAKAKPKTSAKAKTHPVASDVPPIEE